MNQRVSVKTVPSVSRSLVVFWRGLVRLPLIEKFSLCLSIYMMFELRRATEIWRNMEQIWPSRYDTFNDLVFMAGLFLLVMGIFFIFRSKEAASSLVPDKRRRAELIQAVPLMLILAAFCFGINTAFGFVNLRPPYFSASLLFVSLFLLRRTTRSLYAQALEQGGQAATAENEAMRAHLASLQAQLHPHMLFNALNTVASLIRTAPEAAERAVENLAQVLRRSLQHNQDFFCRLSEEVDFLRAYLALEKERLGDRLRVEWQLEPSALEAWIPPLTLQPLVENALKHGIGRRLEGGRLRIAARLEKKVLYLVVEDDGPGFNKHFKAGVGLSNLEARLRVLYGEAAQLRLPESGATITLSLPFRVAA